jgi:hypothetical protein
MMPMDAKRYPAWAADKRRYDCPNSWRAAYEEAVWLPHQLFLGEKRDAQDVLEAVIKFSGLAKELIGFEHPDLRLASVPRNKRAELQLQ